MHQDCHQPEHRRSISNPFILISMRRYSGACVEAASEIASNNGSKRTWVGRQRQPASSGGTRSRPPVRGRQPRWSARSSSGSRDGEGTVGRPQPGRIDCPFVGLGDRPPQIYNPIILADGDGWTTTKAELAPAAVTLSRAHPQRAYVNDNASSTSYIYIYITSVCFTAFITATDVKVKNFTYSLTLDLSSYPVSKTHSLTHCCA